VIFHVEVHVVVTVVFLHDLSPYPRSLSEYSKGSEEVGAGDVEGVAFEVFTQAWTVELPSAIATFAMASNGQKLRILRASDYAGRTSGTRRGSGEVRNTSEE
jgi:hypothetical protein